MNILIVSNEFSNIYNFRLDLINKIQNQFPHFNLIIIAKFDGYEKKIPIYNNKIKLLDINLNSRSYSIANNSLSFFTLIKYIFFYKPDIVISYTIKPNLFLSTIRFFCKFILIANITGLGETFLNKKFKNKIIFYFYNKILSNCNSIIFQNRDDIKILSKNNSKIEKKSSLIKGSGVNTKKFRYKPLIKKKRLMFTFIGRIIQEKGVIEFIKAANKFNKRFPNYADFLIIGTKYDNNIKFNSYFDRFLINSKISYIKHTNNISKYIINTDFVVLPSYREGLSKVLLEALCIGRPIITTDVPGCKELVRHRINGYLVKKRSSEILFRSFHNILKLSWYDIIQMARKSYLVSKEFSEQNINKQFIVLIEKYIHKFK